MKVIGSRTLEGYPASIFQLLLTPLVLRKCIPGCKELREIKPAKYYLYELTYGYKGWIQIEKIYSPSWVGRYSVQAFRSILGALNALHPKILKLFKEYATLPLKRLKGAFPSSLGRFETELIMQGEGSAGSIKGRVAVEVEVGGSQTLVKYNGDIYLGGPAALLGTWPSSVGGLDPEKLLLLFFNNIEAELFRVKNGRPKIE